MARRRAERKLSCQISGVASCLHTVGDRCSNNEITYAPVAPQVHDISLHATRYLDVDADIYAREGIETTAIAGSYLVAARRRGRLTSSIHS